MKKENVILKDIQDAREFAEAIIGTVREPLIILDGDLKVVSVSRAFYRTFGVKAEETEGRFIHELGNRQWDIPQLRTLLEEIIPRNMHFDDFEVAHIFPAIGRRIMLLNARRIPRPPGKARLILLAIEDITERKSAEERKQIEAMARFPSENPNPVLRIARDGTLLYINKGGVEQLPEWHLHVGQRVPSMLGDIASKVLALQSPRSFELGHRGRVFTFFVTPIADAGYANLYGSEITERKWVEESLQESERRFRTLFAQAAVGVALIETKTGRYEDINQRYCDFLGYTKEEMLGSTIVTVSHPDDIQENLRNNALLLAGDIGEFSIEKRYIRKDGAVVWGRLIVSPLWAAGEKPDTYMHIAVVQDITGQKRAEEHEREMERKLLHTQKLESLGVLAGGIAHDFNNLLTAILGNLDLARHDLPAVSPTRTSIDEAIHATMRAADLTRQMLAYSGKGRFVVTDLDISELVEENIHLLKACLSKNTNLNLDTGKGLPLITADAGQIQQVVMNLITNASEALGEQAGIVTLSTGVMDYDATCLKSNLTMEKPAPGRFVWLKVADTGCGMDEETKRRIFDPFFSTKFTGRGLGMSAVLGIVQGHKGSIMLESEVGKGTTVRVQFPVSKTASAGGDPRKKTAKGRICLAGPPPLSGTVLVVDDEEMVRAPCAAMVAHAGYRALTAASGAEAVALFRDHADEIVCIILDLTMPGMDGVATFAALRAIKPDARVILSSGYNEQEATQRFVGHGLAGFIKKPYEMATLLAELEWVVKRDGLKA